MAGEPDNEGWVRLHRKARKSAVFANAELWRLWTLCLMKANHQDAWVHIKGLTDPILVKRGQFITGRKALRKELRSRSSELSVWRWLKKLHTTRKLNIESNTRFSLVTVVNFSRYNPPSDEDEQPNEQQVNNRRTTAEQQLNTNKNEKNEKNEENEKKRRARPVYPEAFEQWWLVYPRQTGGKKKAFAKWKVAVTLVDPETLIERTRVFAASDKGRGDYCPYPTTWLEQGRWDDDPETWKDHRHSRPSGRAQAPVEPLIDLTKLKLEGE